MALSSLTAPASAVHHLQQPPVHLVNRQNSDLPVVVTNNCAETIYPAILTQSGTGPGKSGFRLDSGDSLPQTVSADWKGRVWGRTNCSFSDDGTPTSGQGGAPCSSGDCGAFVECQGAGNPPATLAEFTLASASNQAFYDISLVDGYNLPMGIIFMPGNGSSLSDIPPNFTNAICIGTSSYIDTSATSSEDSQFGSNDSYPIPLEQSMSAQNVLKWCPWPLQLNPPQKPGDGVYPYPDDNIARPIFNPCYSACSKWNDEKYCCSGSYNNPDKCKPSYYSIQAKKVCPDAYSYAYDDQTSTFVLPEGGGFEVVFCPKGRSSNILSTFGNNVRELARTGLVTQEMQTLAKNKTYIAEKSEGSIVEGQANLIALVVVLVWACFW
ncbi:hypothetical protein OHC33_010970 [Knufia fluminis]|uniref:Osmotin, thaumatin-like protein n=1 Tax=Knufia fluminis TaxID=191047 RepID=A0AAN8EDP4_9EURO|nr:hypothetical protein OHC33_010970 [Knufia fluminis]